MPSQLVLLLLAAVVALLRGASVCHGDLQPFCSVTGNYMAGSQFKKNLDDLLLTLSGSAARSSWFNTSTVGTGGDQVFGLIMCYADRNATECLDCLAGAPARTTALCPGSRNVSVNYDACLLRYSGTRFFAAEFTYGADAVDDMAMSSSPPFPNGTDMKAMTDMRSQLMEELMEKAGDRPERMYSYSLPYTDALLGTGVMSGLAQCTRDLAPSECNRCIFGYTQLVPFFFPRNTAASIKGYSCYLRYQLGAMNITPPPPEPATLAMPPSTSPSPGTGRLAIELYVIGSASFIVILLLIWLLVRWWRNKAKIYVEDMLSDDDLALEDEFEKGTGPKRFRYKELSLATDNFSDEKKLGEGGFGSVYRGFLREANLEVAIKRVSKGSKQGKKEYISEVRIISRLRHRNLVQLIGWCHGGGELLLVYELMPNGSLLTLIYTILKTFYGGK